MQFTVDTSSSVAGTSRAWPLRAQTFLTCETVWMRESEHFCVATPCAPHHFHHSRNVCIATLSMITPHLLHKMDACIEAVPLISTEKGAPSAGRKVFELKGQRGTKGKKRH